MRDYEGVLRLFLIGMGKEGDEEMAMLTAFCDFGGVIGSWDGLGV